MYFNVLIKLKFKKYLIFINSNMIDVYITLYILMAYSLT